MFPLIVDKRSSDITAMTDHFDLHQECTIFNTTTICYTNTTLMTHKIFTHNVVHATVGEYLSAAMRLQENLNLTSGIYN